MSLSISGESLYVERQRVSAVAIQKSIHTIQKVSRSNSVVNTHLVDLERF
jgi:hypothetical protein